MTFKSLSQRDAELIQSAILRFKSDTPEAGAAIQLIGKVLKRYDVTFDDLYNDPSVFLGNDAEVIRTYRKQLSLALEANKGIASQNVRSISENKRLRKQEIKDIRGLNTFFGVLTKAKESILSLAEYKRETEAQIEDTTRANENLAKQNLSLHARNELLANDNKEVVQLRQDIQKAKKAQDSADSRAYQKVYKENSIKMASIINEFNALSEELRKGSLSPIVAEGIGHTIVRQASEWNKPLRMNTFVFNALAHYHKENKHAFAPFDSGFSGRSLGYSDWFSHISKVESFIHAGGEETYNAADEQGRTELMCVMDYLKYHSGNSPQHHHVEDDALDVALHAARHLFFVKSFTPNPLAIDHQERTELMTVVNSGVLLREVEGRTYYPCPLNSIKMYLERGGVVRHNQIDDKGRSELMYLLDGRGFAEANKALSLYYNHGGRANAGACYNQDRSSGKTEAKFVLDAVGISGLEFYIHNMGGQLNPSYNKYHEGNEMHGLSSSDLVRYQKILNAQYGIGAPEQDPTSTP